MQNTNIRPILHCGTAWLSDLRSSKEFIYHSTAASVKEKRVTQFVIWFLRRRALLGPARWLAPPLPYVQDNRTGEGGSSHNSPAGVTRQSSCGNSAPLQVVVESWRIHSPCHVLCVGGAWGGGCWNREGAMFRSHAASGFLTIEVIGQAAGNVRFHLYFSGH